MNIPFPNVEINRNFMPVYISIKFIIVDLDLLLRLSYTFK